MVTRLHKALCAALLLPLLLVAVCGTSVAAWRCRYDGIARSVSCCPKKAHHVAEDPGNAATVGAAECCDLEQSRVAKAPSNLPRTQTTPALDLDVLATPVAVLAMDVSPQRRVLLPVPQVRPHSGLALLRLKRSFLI